MRCGRKITTVLSVSSAVLLTSSTLAFAATTTYPGNVIPLNNPLTIAGEKINLGYQVGESIVYPITGGFNIIANPNIHWTYEAKLAYVKNQQAERDLTILLNSSYANSPDIQHAKKPSKQLLDAIKNVENTSATNNANNTVAPSVTPISTYSHTFSTTAWGSLGGVANQIET